MTPFYKLAAPTDIDTLIDLMSDFYVHEHLNYDEQFARSALQQVLNNKVYGQIYLIFAGEDVVGYLVIGFGFSLEFGGRNAFVDELYIKENYRGQGIGKQSLKFAEEVCRQEGIHALHLEVLRENTVAQSIYRKAGFVDHDRYLWTKWL